MMRHNIGRAEESQNQRAAALLADTIWAGLGESWALPRLLRERDAAAWSRLAAAAARARLEPLAYAGCRAASTAGAPVPAGVVAGLRRHAALAAARNVRLERSAGGVLAAAADAGVHLLFLKGLPLGKLVYPEGAPRPMDDVDLLVAPHERARMADLLLGLGYRNDLRGEEDFFAPDRFYSFDLHVGLLNTTRLPARGHLAPLPFEALWSRAQPVTIAGSEARTLGPADTLGHLALHAVHHHGLSGDLWPIDFALVLRRWPGAAANLAGMPPAIRRSVWYCLEALAGRGVNAAGSRAALQPRRFLPGERWAVRTAGRGTAAEEVRYGLTLACLPARTRLRFLLQLITGLPSLHGDGFGDARTGQRFGWLAALWSGRGDPIRPRSR
jgi:hypothetical protein